MAEIEQGPMTMRWNRSRCVPMAAATAALMVSAWEAHTMVSPGWAATSSAMVLVMRCCISLNDSPPGNRNPLGYRWTWLHSGSLLRSASLRPVHSPKSASIRPLRIWTR